MSKQSLFPMSNEVALDLIKEWLKPGTPSLSGMFCWSQPDSESVITLGNAYGTIPDKWSIREILMQDVYINHAIGYKSELRVKLETAKTALRECKAHNISHDKEFSISGIYELENVSINYRELDAEQKCQYRLAVMWLNSMLDLHNWAIEYINYLAEYCANGYDKDWRLYEQSSKGDDIYNAILECGENPLGIVIEEAENPYYDYDDKADAEIYQFLKDQYENDLDGFAEIFGLKSLMDYEFAETATILALSIEQVKALWSNGDLDLVYSDEIESKIVKDFIFNYQNQGVLEGFE